MAFVVPVSEDLCIHPATPAIRQPGGVLMQPIAIPHRKFAVAFLAASFAVLGGVAMAQQNKDSVKVPDGLALSEFKGYEKWQVIGVSYAADHLAVILGNPEMI